MVKGKVLQISAVATTMDKQLRPLIQGTIINGYEVHLACDDDGYLEKLREDGFIAHQIHFDRKINLKSNIKSIIELYKLMKLYKYDIVHVHTPVASILGRIAAKLARIPNIIYTAHGYYFHEGMAKKQYLAYYYIEKIFARFSTDYILLQSKEDYELSINNKFKRESKIIHLGNGVDIKGRFNPSKYSKEQITQLKHDLNIREKDLVITFIGRFVEEKGIIELVTAFERINNNIDNVRLMLIGDLNESERDQNITNYINKWKENKNIIFTGVRSDIPELLLVSDVFVLPSHREGLPRSIVEAMAMKNPVVATKIRGCREQVVEGKTGFLVDKYNVEELTDKIMMLLYDKQLRISFGEYAREIAEKEYDEDKVISKQLNLFESLV